MYLSIIILPLLSSAVSGLMGRRIGVSGSRLLGCLSVTTTTILAIIAFFEVGLNNNSVSINLFKWLDSESFNILWNFQFDSLTVSMLIPVLVISSLVHFYSIGYMSQDPHNQRFFSYLSLFTFMMILLVTGNNYLLMFVGWEGVGVCSYLLVSFWFTRIAANQSSMSAFLTNRVGDCFLTIGMFAVLWSLGNLDYSVVFSLSPYLNINVIAIIGICLLIGAMAKSSQVGLHIWLPMAMEGPTPVSALIHAATMVTAGVYLLIRSSPLIEYSSTVLLICLWLGAITTVFSSLVGLFQQDIKKIIAYSTMSQLGMMVIAIGLSSYNVALFHLINHAFYKGLLFLGAGAVIHAVADNQDLRKYGGLREFLPLTYTVILIASLSLVAFPFMTGFYSKDFILESAYGQYHFSSINVYVIAVIGAIFTTLYSVKILYLTFLANPNGSVNYSKNAHEGDIFLSLPLVILAIFSVYFGFITKDIYIGLGSGFFADNSIFIHPLHEILIDTEFGVPTIFKLIPVILTLFFTALSLGYLEFIPNHISNFKFSSLGYYVFGFFNQRFLVEFFYNKYIVNSVLIWGGQTTKILDKGSVEWIGPYGYNIALTKVSKTISNLSKGVVTDYAVYILISVCFYLFIFTFISEFYDLAYSITGSCISILILLGSMSFISNVENNTYIDQENLESGLWNLFKYWCFYIISYIRYYDPIKLPRDLMYIYISYFTVTLGVFIFNKLSSMHGELIYEVASHISHLLTVNGFNLDRYMDVIGDGNNLYMGPIHEVTPQLNAYVIGDGNGPSNINEQGSGNVPYMSENAKGKLPMANQPTDTTMSENAKGKVPMIKAVRWTIEPEDPKYLVIQHPLVSGYLIKWAQTGETIWPPHQDPDMSAADYVRMRKMQVQEGFMQRLEELAKTHPQAVWDRYGDVFKEPRYTCDVPWPVHYRFKYLNLIDMEPHQVQVEAKVTGNNDNYYRIKSVFAKARGYPSGVDPIELARWEFNQLHKGGSTIASSSGAAPSNPQVDVGPKVASSSEAGPSNLQAYVGPKVAFSSGAGPSNIERHFNPSPSQFDVYAKDYCLSKSQVNLAVNKNNADINLSPSLRRLMAERQARWELETGEIQNNTQQNASERARMEFDRENFPKRRKQ